MTNAAARTGAEILAEIQPKLRRGVAHVCLRPDLVDAWEEAQEALIAAKSKDEGNGRLAQGGVSKATREAAERVRAIEEQIEAADLRLEFEKIGKTQFSELCDEHPPREKNMGDMMAGYNRETVDNELAHLMLVDPVFERCEKRGCTHDDCGSWEALVKLLGPGDWEEIVTVIREVNGSVSGAPKSVLASRVLDRPASGSARRARGA